MGQRKRSGQIKWSTLQRISIINSSMWEAQSLATPKSRTFSNSPSPSSPWSWNPTLTPRFADLSSREEVYSLVATVEGREGLIFRHLGPCTGVSWTLLSERGLALAADERGNHSYMEKDRDIRNTDGISAASCSNPSRTMLSNLFLQSSTVTYMGMAGHGHSRSIWQSVSPSHHVCMLQ